MKILFITNIPSPYRVAFFNELGKMCDLTVLFERANSLERDTNWLAENFINFKGTVLQGIRVGTDKAICFSVWKWLTKNSYDGIVITNTATPTGILAIEIMKAKKIPFAIEGDGGFAKSGQGIKEHLKRHLIQSASYWFSTGNTHTQYYLAYGAKKENIYVYPFSSLRNDDILPEVISNSEKIKLKGKIGIAEKRAIISVGQFIYRKGFDILLKAACQIPRDVGVYLVGGEPTQEYIDIKRQYRLENVHFVGFKTKEKLTEYYKACDIFVLPTREDIWGLVINEAMACGLPIITTDRCIAGLELVKNNKNGYTVPVGDEKQLAEKVNDILENPKLKETMSITSLEQIKEFTIENMAKQHIEIFKRFYLERKYHDGLC